MQHVQELEKENRNNTDTKLKKNVARLNIIIENKFMQKTRRILNNNISSFDVVVIINLT